MERLTSGGVGLLLGCALVAGGCASGSQDPAGDLLAGDDDTEGSGDFSSTNDPVHGGDAGTSNGESGSNIGDQSISSEGDGSQQGEGSSNAGDEFVRDGDSSGDGDGSVECLDRDQALADFAEIEVSLPACEDDVCKNAHCLSANVISADQVDFLAACTETEKCVPDTLIATLGMAALPGCNSVDGAEGRCVSMCVPLVRDQLDVLPRDSCADDELCAPCFDPVTHEATGACTLSCDAGPVDEPYFFPDCCGDIGVCVPTDFVPAGQKGLLGKDTCSGDAVLCAPREFASDRSLAAPQCTSLEGAEGRCLATCIPDVARQADMLPKDVCEAGHLCAPCYDPISGADTGACSIGDDAGPTGGPVVFDTCCNAAGNDVGVCVPSAIVPAAQADLLGADSCTGSGYLCAPADVAAGSYVPTTCSVPGGLEGRCLPGCLPDIAAQADFLTQEICADGYLCAPCYDPFTGADTGACTLGGDSPADTPSTFDRCCNDGSTDVGTCVPTALVPGELQSMLDTDGGACTPLNSEATLCAPTDVSTGSYSPEVCGSWYGESNVDQGDKAGPGRCLPGCLRDVAAQAALLTPDDASDGCPDANERCVPCHDPVTGESTGACTLPGDSDPVEKITFTNCCATDTDNSGATPDVPLGRCIPSYAAGARASSLPTLSCEGAGEPGLADTGNAYLCAPNDAVADPDFVFTSCNTVCDAGALACIGAAVLGINIGGQAGVCLPSCMLSETDTTLGSADGVFGQSSCAIGWDCAPCIDPETDLATGACPPAPP